MLKAFRPTDIWRVVFSVGGYLPRAARYMEIQYYQESRGFPAAYEDFGHFIKEKTSRIGRDNGGG